MIARKVKSLRPSTHWTKSIFVPAALAACSVLLSAGCSMLPAGMNKLPAKVGLKTKQAELRERVQADKFPTAKEAGLQ
jgi:hypothetical protein